MRLTGNKGEWSELYAFVKLLSLGRLYAADENTRPIGNLFFPIMKILRQDEPGENKEYVISSMDGTVEIHLHSRVLGSIERSVLEKSAKRLFSGIILGGERAFEIPCSEAIMEELFCTKIAAPSTDKTDILMQLHDVLTGYELICGFSIKSQLGSAATLLNASGATNFRYEVEGLSDQQILEVNAINTHTKIIDRVQRILKYGKLRFDTMENLVFAGNLLLIDSHMDQILSELLLDYYKGNSGNCCELVERIEKKNPLRYLRGGVYQHKLKKLLCSVALGMVPTQEWDGQDEANGGYVIVKSDGDVVAYHIYNRDAFESYLLHNTKFDRGSTSKHKFATIYKIGRKAFINLNLQIRFL